MSMVQPEDLYEPEWVAWFSFTPQERMAESAKLWQIYLEMGGQFDPDPDPQSPFFFSEDVGAVEAGHLSDEECGAIARPAVTPLSGIFSAL